MRFSGWPAAVGLPKGSRSSMASTLSYGADKSGSRPSVSTRQSVEICKKIITQPWPSGCKEERYLSSLVLGIICTFLFPCSLVCVIHYGDLIWEHLPKPNYMARVM